MRLQVCFFLVIGLLGPVLLPLRGQPASESVKYVFLFIGDGMATPQRELGEQYSLACTGQGLKMNRLPVNTLTTTHSANQEITDSAASGTAIACGQKTNNLYLGVDPEGKPLESIAKIALRHGRRVGIITSVTLNHATPGAFYATVPNRNQYYEIGLAMLESGFHYFAGGGLQAHNNQESPLYRGNLYELAAQAGYMVCKEDTAAFRSLTPGSAPKVMVFAHASAMPYEIVAPNDALTLLDLTRKGIELLDNPEGFFLMVEGGLIDYAAHGNQAELMLGEMLGLDRSISAALDFARQHPEDTLIVVTGDHETGGLTLSAATEQDKSKWQQVRGQHLLTERFDAKIRQIIAQPDTTLDTVLALAEADFGLTGGLTADERQQIELSFQMERQRAEYQRQLTALEQDFAARKAGRENAEIRVLEQEFSAARAKLAAEHKKQLQKYPQLSLARQVAAVCNQRLGISWKTTGHSSLPVQTSAIGKHAERFREATDNCRIAHILTDLLQ